MTREECRRKIDDHIRAIMDIYREYHPEGNYISATMWAKENKYFCINDVKDPEDKQLDMFYREN